MAISEFELFKVESIARAFCEDRNKHLPSEKLYIDYKMDDQILYILEVRPRWDDPTEKTEFLVAKFIYVKKNSIWRLYWQRQNMKWQQYKPNGVDKDLESLIKIVSEDTQGCFWG